jgi:hypothetical protein
MTCETDNYGTKIWRNENGMLHRNNDLPTIECATGDKEWYINGKRHRLGGLPAIEYANGEKHWYENGKRHRLGGLVASEWVDGSKAWFKNDKLHRLGDLPAIENINGDKHWYENNKRHRLGGLPAVECANGYKQWYIYNKKYTYEKIINYYKILTRFGRYCLKKIRLRQLKRAKFTHVELLCKPSNGRYPGGQDSHKVISYFMNM